MINSVSDTNRDMELRHLVSAFLLNTINKLAPDYRLVTAAQLWHAARVGVIEAAKLLPTTVEASLANVDAMKDMVQEFRAAPQEEQEAALTLAGAQMYQGIMALTTLGHHVDEELGRVVAVLVKRVEESGAIPLDTHRRQQTSDNMIAAAELVDTLPEFCHDLVARANAEVAYGVLRKQFVFPPEMNTEGQALRAESDFAARNQWISSKLSEHDAQQAALMTRYILFLGLTAMFEAGAQLHPALLEVRDKLVNRGDGQLKVLPSGEA